MEMGCRERKETFCSRPNASPKDHSGGAWPGGLCGLPSLSAEICVICGKKRASI